MRKFFRPFFYAIGLLALQPLFSAADIKDSQLAQEYQVRAWQTDDGLPQNWVSSIAQTPDGYLWIGTRYGGLARFDGVRFVSFNPQNTPELRDIQVESAGVDDLGTLWVMMGNESVTAFKNGQFYLYRPPRTSPRFRLMSVLAATTNKVLFADDGTRLASLDLTGTNTWKLLAPFSASGSGPVFWSDHAGTIWFLTQPGGLGRYTGGKISNYTGTDLPKSRLIALSADAHGRIWVASANQIFRRTGDVFQDETPTNGPPPARVRDLVAGPDGGFWVRDGNRLRKGSGRVWLADVTLPDTIQRDNTAHNVQLNCDAEGNAWFIDYGHGLWCIKPDGSAFELTESDGLPSAFITCWFQDKEGNIWAGSVGGMARISKRIVHILGQAEKLPGKIARSVCVDQQGTLWAGTMSGGLAYWESNSFVRLALPSFNALTPLESITVCPAYDGNLWIGTLRHGLMQYQSGAIRRMLPLTTLASVRILFEDSQHRMWVGGLADLRYYDRGTFYPMGSDQGFQSGIAVGAMAEDSRGTIWIGTGPGDLWKFQDGKFTKYPPPLDWPSSRFAAVLPDADGSVWVGTLGGGLLRFKAGVFSRYTSQQGLPNAYISQLRQDKQGNLWAGTYAGIARFSKSNLNAVADGTESHIICRVYGRSSGLSALECTSGFQPSCWTSPDGGFWFSTAAGLAYVNPNDPFIAASQAPPPVVIEEISVDGMSLTNPISSSLPGPHPELNIEPGQHFVQFRFTGVSLAAPDEVSFRVKLAGAETHWRDLGFQRTVGYGPLAPGHYQLQVLASTSGGPWSERGASLAFNVLPFFWQTLSFKAGLLAGLFLLTGLLVTLALTRRYRLEMQKLKTQHELDRERARIAQDLHDDLGTSLTQISLLSALADRGTTGEEIKSLNQQIRLSSRAMVVALDEIVWAVNPRNDSPAELINYLANFADEFFRATPISCRLEIPGQLPANTLSSEMRHHLFLAFKESINNTARHSKAAHVWITVAANANEIVITIKDDGVGFDAASADFKSGNGLLNLRNRLEGIGGRAEIKSAPGQGTTVTIHLPLKSEA